MADNALRSLIYIIEGQSSPLEVEIAGDERIHNLKDLIRDRGRNRVFRSVNPKDLILWKVRISVESDSTTTNSPAGSYRTPSQGGASAPHWSNCARFIEN